MRILIADENIILRKQLRQRLERMNHIVDGEAKNGLHVFHKYVEMNPELLFMNLDMTMYDGISAMRRILSHDPDARIVVMVEKEQNKRVFEALEHGAIHYLQLPVDDKKINRIMTDIEKI